MTFFELDLEVIIWKLVTMTKVELGHLYTTVLSQTGPTFTALIILRNQMSV